MTNPPSRTCWQRRRPRALRAPRRKWPARSGLASLLVISASVLWSAAGLAGTGEGIELLRYRDQSTRISTGPARFRQQVGLAVWFHCTEDLHFYASPKTAPSADAVLQVTAQAQDVQVGQPVFPRPGLFHDPGQQRQVEVYSGDFFVFLPVPDPPSEPFAMTVRITGLACTSQVCLPPFEKVMEVEVDLAGDLETPLVAPARSTGTPRELLWYLGLALAAGLGINLMPCVLPVLPLIVLRLIRQSQGTARQRLARGAAFCGGMIGFFAILAIVALGMNLATGAVVGLNSLFRYPSAVIALFLAILFFALVLFDLVTISIPGKVASRLGEGQEVAASAATGMFAAVLSVPCSGALLGFVMVWAQTQPAIVGAAAMITVGIGMSLPYAVLVAIPGLVSYLPKPGRWMDLFKKSCGLLLLLVAIKVTLTALPKDRLINVLFYAVIFSGAVWIWGSWAGQTTSRPTKWAIRWAAVCLAVSTGIYLLPPPGEDLIDWTQYDPAILDQAREEGRPVLLKFTAQWCTNCTVVDRRVYREPLVARRIADKGVLAVQADTTRYDQPATKDLRQVYGESGSLPVSILLLPDGRKVILRGIFDKQRLLEVLDGLPDRRSP